MFRRHYKRRSSFLPFVIFRLFLSLIIFAILAGGIYAAYKQFSGVDPKGIDPKALVFGILNFRDFSFKDFNFFEEKNIMENKSVIPRDSSKPVSRNPIFTFALISDSHNENNYLQQALIQAKSRDVKFVIGLGDYTEVGTVQELQDVKQKFDEAGLRYFVAAGDHDLWDSRDKQKPSLENFNQVFGPSFQSFSFEGAKFLILDNSDNYKGLSEDQLEWIKFELDKAKKEKDNKLTLAFLHEPLSHPSSTRIMGKVTTGLIEEARNLAQTLKSNGVKEIFAGDIHYFTRYTDQQSGLAMTTIGAVASQRNTQTPRFAIVTIYDDFELNVEDVEVK